MHLDDIVLLFMEIFKQRAVEKGSTGKITANYTAGCDFIVKN